MSHTAHLYRVILPVPDLEATLARVQTAGGTIDAGIERMPWGERLFYARATPSAAVFVLWMSGHYLRAIDAKPVMGFA